MSLGIKTSKKSDIKKTLNLKKNLKKIPKIKKAKIFEFSRGKWFLEIYAESSSEILGIKIDFWLTPLVFLNLFMVFQKAKNSFSISRCGFFFHCLSPCCPDDIPRTACDYTCPGTGCGILTSPNSSNLLIVFVAKLIRKKKLKINKVRSDWCEVWGQKIFKITHF